MKTLKDLSETNDHILDKFVKQNFQNRKVYKKIFLIKKAVV